VIELPQLGMKILPITVLMSVYNGSRWLDEAIQSVLNQTFIAFEFIIINDGSTDNSLEIINQFAAGDPRIVVINKLNTGLADSLNQGIEQARGEWIARIDADDVCEPERLSKQYTCAQSTSSLVLIGTGLREIDEQGRPGKVYLYPAAHKVLVRQLITARRFFAHSTAFYRTETVKALGGYRARIKRAQDWDLWLRLSEVGDMVCLSEPLVKLRKHAGQISHDESGQRQKIDARVALISYYLRQHGFVDPVPTDDTDTDFDNFREWVAMRLKQERVFDYYSFIHKVKQQLTDGGISLKGLTGLATLLLREPGFVCRHFRQFVSGEELAQRLAAEWEARKMPCAE